jgi:DNA-binding NtrC family response regulator
MAYPLLIVDDDGLNLAAIQALLQKQGFHVDTARSGDEAIGRVSASPWRYGVVVLDFRMDGKNGAETAKEILAIAPHLFVLIHSGDDTREALQASWEAGVVKFIEKSRGAESFVAEVETWCRKYEAEVRPGLPKDSPAENEKLITSLGMVGCSSGMAQIARRIQKFQEEDTDLNVLVLGENGVGKELIARALHTFSSRNRQPFIAIDAGSLPENLVESELFGHEKGAFTGADQKRVGAFQAADRGTLFLDEVGNMSLAAQAKLLRALQNRTIRPVGTNREIPVNVRVVSATNQDLKKAVREGRFREDLYFRLKGILISLPPLRERIEDLPLLVNRITQRYNEGKKNPKSVSPSALRLLEKHGWPGNIRELENTVLQALTETYGDSVSANQVASQLGSSPVAARPSNSTLKNYIDDMTRQYVLGLLETSRSKLEAATKAGMAESTFRDLLKRLGLQKHNSPED